MGDAAAAEVDRPGHDDGEGHLVLASQLADAVVAIAQAPLPAAVRLEAERSLVNIVGTAVRASRDPAVDQVLEVARLVGGP